MAQSGDRTRTTRVMTRPSDVRSSGAVTVDAEKTVRVDWAKLPAPTNVYDADFAWAVERHGTVSLFFAKEHISGKRLRTRMEIRFAPEPFVHNLWDDSVRFYQDLKARGLAAFGAAPPTRTPEDLMALESDREHSDWANFSYIAHHGIQASLDFFRLPPAGVARFVTTGGISGLEPNPIVRVHTTIWELMRLFEVCEPIASRARAALPAEVKA